MRKSIQVICVDDDKETGSLLKRILELVGIKVSAYLRSAEELLAIMNTSLFQEAAMFIIDVQLPMMSGVELATKLRSNGEHRPIIMLSGFSKDEGWGLKDINVEFVQKPYDFNELQHMIKTLACEPVIV
jgi:FixJ family two-component response regulator